MNRRSGGLERTGPFGILVGQAWGWRDAMCILVALAAISGLSVATLPAAHAPLTGLRNRMRVLSDPRVVGILLGTVTVMTPGFLIIAYLPTILHASRSTGGPGSVEQRPPQTPRSRPSN
jgi:MFS transporter, DHA1 family, inner membrane transport protein